MKRFWVTGGLFADTNFEKLQPGQKLEKIGPFATYEEAKAAWQKRAWESVDQANARFHIVEEGAAPQYWVVGCPYKDTHFQEPADGGGEEWHGPFSTYDEAKREWSRLSWSNVDDALCRYRIETLAPGQHPRSSKNKAE